MTMTKQSAALRRWWANQKVGQAKKEKAAHTKGRSFNDRDKCLRYIEAGEARGKTMHVWLVAVGKKTTCHLFFYASPSHNLPKWIARGVETGSYRPRSLTKEKVKALPKYATPAKPEGPWRRFNYGYWFTEKKHGSLAAGRASVLAAKWIEFSTRRWGIGIHIYKVSLKTTGKSIGYYVTQRDVDMLNNRWVYRDVVEITLDDLKREV